MAKISARGAVEVRRWIIPGRTLVLCSDGRLLSKTTHSGYTLQARLHSPHPGQRMDQAQAIVERLSGGQL